MFRPKRRRHAWWALSVVPVALTDKPYLSLPGEGLSLQHFERLFASREWLASFVQSGIIGFAARL